MIDWLIDWLPDYDIFMVWYGQLIDWLISRFFYIFHWYI